MADDDNQSSADPGMPGSPGDPNVPADASGYPEAGAPKAESAKEKPQESTAETAQKGYIQMMTKLQQESATREQDMQAKLMPELKSLMELAHQPAPTPPQPAAAPPPPTEQQKGGLSEFVFNLLKFGALTAIAFGTGGRGMGHNAIAKSALGAALTGYAAGRKDVANRSMQVWEKNNEIVKEANRQQNAQYKDILESRNMNLRQKMDLLNGISSVYRDYKAYDASRRQDLMAAQNHLEKQQKLQQDHEDYINKHRDKIYSVLGKNQMTAQYLDWLNQKSGGKVTLTGSSSADDWYKVEKDHPELSFSSFKKEHDQEEIRQVAAKTGAEEEARLKAKKKVEEGDTAGPSSEGAAKAAKILEGLVQ